MRIASMVLVFSALLAVPVVSEATPISVVIDFNSAPVGTYSNLVVGDFTFTFFFGDPQQVATLSAGNNALEDSNNQNVNGAEVTMARTNGDPFTITQFDIVNLSGDQSRGVIVVGGIQYWKPGFYDAPLSQTVLRNNLVDVTAVNLNIVSLRSVLAIDNIHVTYEPAAELAAVPEPATLALLAPAWPRARRGDG